MEIVGSLAQLRSDAAWWVPAVVAPMRNWPGAPGCRRGARFLVDAATFRPALTGFPAFPTRAECLRWILEHRQALGRSAPGVAVTAARLDAWILGLV